MAHIVIVGNGVAGNGALDAIRRYGGGAHLMLISQEQFPEYSACLLTDYLSGKLDRMRVFLKGVEDYYREGIETLFGETVLEINNLQRL